MKNDIKEILISEEQIKQRVKELAAEINRDYAGRVPLFIGVLRGSFVFMADLLREITIPCTVDFLALSSYGSNVKTTGNVKITKDLEIDIGGRDVIIVEDILDSGYTLSYLISMFKTKAPASLALCTLLSKPSRRVVEVHTDYCGFEVPDEFVVGYGLDYNDLYRNYPCIGVLKPEIYSD